MSQTNMSGPLAVAAGNAPSTGLGLVLLLGGLPPVNGAPNLVEGNANTVAAYFFGKGAIANNTATSIFTISVNNVATRACYEILVSAGITNASHIYDSTRVVKYLLTLTRVPGAALVATLSAAIGAAIATSSGGQTLTVTGGLSAIGGGVTAVNTVDFQLTNVNASAGTTEASCWVTGINAVAQGPTVAQA